jgi:ribosomal protein L35AE/L33A
MTSALDLDIAVGGSVAYKTSLEGKKILGHILEKHNSSIVETKPLLEKPLLISRIQPRLHP